MAAPTRVVTNDEAALGQCATEWPRLRRVTRPNIVFVMPDEWRADMLGFAGNPIIETPNIDGLAARGVSFEAPHFESPVCQSSRASLIPGRFPRDHGLYDNEQVPEGEFRVGTFPAPGVIP